MLALVDCNTFQVSCERLFRPDLEKQPVVVLSNNNGSVVARSQDVKNLSVKMVVPWFQLRDLAQEYWILAVFSHYALYADMSGRIMSLLRGLAPWIEVYSIDEFFLDVTGIAGPEQMGYLTRARFAK